MGTFSIFHWLVILAVLAIFAYPVSRIIRRTGASGWWALLACIPLVNIVALWVFAFAPWKIDATKAAHSF